MWFGPGVRSQKCGRRKESKRDCKGQVVAAVNGVSEPSRCTEVLTDGSRLRHWRDSPQEPNRALFTRDTQPHFDLFFKSTCFRTFLFFFFSVASFEPSGA